MDDRRRLAGAIGSLWCRQCKGRVTIAGRRAEPGDGPLVDLIICPFCRSMRRMVLPPMVSAPFRVVAATDDRLRGR